MARAAELVASVREYRDSRQVLSDVLTAFGTKVFGAVLLHAMEAKDSLAGNAESMSSFPSLRPVGVMVRDLGWPEGALSVGYPEDAVDGYRPCSFAAGLAAAAVLGYTTRHDKCTIEHHLMEHRLHGSHIAQVRALSNDGISPGSWARITAGFDLVGGAERVDAPSVDEMTAAADVWRRAFAAENGVYMGGSSRSPSWVFLCRARS